MFAGKPDPDHLGQYQHLTSEGLDIYIHRGLVVEPGGLDVAMAKWAFMKRLKVTGVKVR